MKLPLPEKQVGIKRGDWDSAGGEDAGDDSSGADFVRLQLVNAENLDDATKIEYDARQQSRRDGDPR